MAKDVSHFGPVGAGTRFKLILNALQAVHLAGVRRGDAAGRGAPGSTSVRWARPWSSGPAAIVTRMAPTAYPDGPERVSFPVALGVQGPELRGGHGRGPVGSRTRCSTATRAAFARAVDAGHGEADWTAAIATADHHPT